MSMYSGQRHFGFLIPFLLVFRGHLGRAPLDIHVRAHGEGDQVESRGDYLPLCRRREKPFSPPKGRIS